MCRCRHLRMQDWESRHIAKSTMRLQKIAYKKWWSALSAAAVGFLMQSRHPHDRDARGESSGELWSEFRMLAFGRNLKFSMRAVGVVALLCLVNLGGPEITVSAKAQEPVRSALSHLQERQVRLLEEVERNQRDLEEFYRNVEISAIERRFAEPLVSSELPVAVEGADLKLTGITEYRYAALNGAFYRLDGKALSTDDGTTVLEVQAGIIRPEESHLFGYDLESKRYYLKAHGKDHVEYMNILYSYNFPVAPFACDGMSVVDFIFTKDSLWNVVDVSETPDLATVVVEGTFGQSRMRRTFVFLKDQRWALAEAVVESADPKEKTERQKVVHTRSYSGDFDGFPLLKRVVTEGLMSSNSGDELRLVSQIVTEIREIKVGTADPQLFMPQRLVPGVGRVGDAFAPGWTTWILLANGLLLIAFGVWLARRSRADHERCSDKSANNSKSGEQNEPKPAPSEDVP